MSGAAGNTLRLFLATLTGLLLVVAAVNAWTDLSGLATDADAVLELARRQQPGQVLVSERDFDQRAWVKARLESAGGCPELLVLGSSTLGMVSASMLPDRGTFLNGWLTGPSVEDFEAITTILGRGGCVPRRIVLGVDPFLLNPLVTDQRWLTLRRERAAFQSGLGAPGVAQELLFRWQVLKEQLTFSTTRDSFLHLARGGRQSQSLPELLPEPPDAFCAKARREPTIRHLDGHFSSCPRFELRPEDATAVAASYVERDAHRIRSWPRLDEGRLGRLFKVIDAWIRRGSRVTLLAPPYHPRTFARLHEAGSVRALLQELDDQVRAKASASGARFVNLRDPAQNACVETEFSDSHHMRPSCAARVMSRAMMASTE